MYGIVMAGGLSSRMGRNKLRLSIHGDGKDMLERTVELLGGFTDDVFVSCRAPEDAAPFKAIPDEVDRQGPFGGVYSALRRLQKPILVLSCDLPFMDGPTLRRLLDAREARLPGTIMTTYQQEETGFIEALVAVYEPACLPWFDAAWEQGIRKFSVVIAEELRTTALAVSLVTLAMGNVAFLLYDRALHNMLMLYRLVWQPKLHKMLGVH